MSAPGGPIRIVSLLPSATEMVAALGFGQCLVGRSHECDHPPDVSGLPVLTQAMLDAGLETDSIRRILGGNALRVLRATLP